MPSTTASTPSFGRPIYRFLAFLLAASAIRAGIRLLNRYQAITSHLLRVGLSRSTQSGVPGSASYSPRVKPIAAWASNSSKPLEYDTLIGGFDSGYWLLAIPFGVR